MSSIGTITIDFVAGLGRFTRELNQINSQLGGISSQAQRTADSISNMGRALAGLAVGVLANEVVRLSDSFKLIEARLKLATGAAEDFNATFKDVFDIAQRTSTSLESTANLYGKVSAALMSMGQSTEAAAGITETINQAFKVSGAGAAESAAAIQQLNQALASGVLRGEEFNSIAEQGPRLLKAIADATGNTTGELRKLAAEGKLTANVVINALKGQADAISGEFAQLPQTVGASFQQLRNQVLVSVGEIDKELNANSAIAGFIQSATAGLAELSISFRNSLGDIGPIVSGVGQVVTALIAIKAASGFGAILSASFLLVSNAATASTASILASAAASQTATGAALREATANQTAVAAVITRRNAELASIATKRANITATLAVAQATFAQSGSQASLNALIAAGNKAAQTRATLDAKELTARAQLAAATEAQALAQAQLNAAQAAALGLGARLGAGIASLGSGLLALTGGPIGATILALGGLVYWFSSVRREQERIAKQTVDTTNSLNLFSQQIRNGFQVFDFKESNKKIAESRAEVDRLREAFNKVANSEARLAIALGGTFDDAALKIVKGSTDAGNALNQAEAELAQLERAATLASQLGLTAVVDKFKEIITGSEEAKSALIDIGGVLIDVSKLLAAARQTVDPVGELLKEQAAGIAAVQQAIQGGTATIDDLAIQYAANRIALDNLRKSQAGYKAEVKAGSAAEKEAAKAAKDASAADKERQRVLMAAEEAERSRADSVKAFRNGLASLAAELGGPIARITEDYKQDVEELATQIAELGLGSADYAAKLALLTAKRDKDIAAAKRQIEYTKQQRDVVGNLIREIEADIRLTGLSADARQQEVAVMQAVAQATQAGIKLREGEAEAIRETIRALQQAERAANFDFAKSFNSALSRAFETGSATAGFQQFIDDFKKALSGGVESALGAVNSTLQFAAPIIDAYRNSDGNAVGAGLRALNNQLAQSGNVFAQIASTVDSLFGGRLFGTDFATTRTGFNASIGSGGISGTQFEDQSRQRSFFRGTARRTLTEGLDQSTVSALKDFFRQIQSVVGQAARDLGTSIPSFIEGAFREVQDANGKIIEQFGTVLGRQFKETFEEFQQRVLAENILAVIDQLFTDAGNMRPPASNVTDPTGLIGGGGGDQRENPNLTAIKGAQAYAGEASAIAERWRMDAATLLDGAQFLLAAAIDINRGIGLLDGEGGLTAVTALIEDLQGAGESLQDTYARVSQATNLFEQAIALTGTSLDLSREAFVRAATEIAESAGGIERANALWNAYFETFYSDSERAVAAVAGAQERLVKELTDIGLEGISKEDFRARFEELLPTLTPAQIAQYLEAAQAFGILDEALTAAAEASQAMADETQRIADEAQAAAEALADAFGALADFNRGISEQLEDMGLSEFGRGLVGIRRELQQNIQAVNDYARAAGLEAASAQDLARVHELAARRVRALIEQMTATVRDRANALYGPLALVNRRISELQAEASSAASVEIGNIGAVAEANASRYEDELAAIEEIRGFVKSLLLDTQLTTLTPQERLGEASSQFAALLARAQGGDVDALQQLTGAAQAYLQEARSFFASGDEYTRIFDSVTGILAGLTPRLMPTPEGGPGGGLTGYTASAEITALEAERDRLQREQDRAERAAQAQELVGFLRELAQATSANVLELAASFGVPLDLLAMDLGANLTDLTVASVQSLAALAAGLGVDLASLTAQIGIDLGSLADDQSLLNDGLESVIATLPANTGAVLGPLLQALEDATTEADANEALQDLIDAASDQPRAIQQLLAPYLAGLNIGPALTDLSYLEGIESFAGEQLDAINATNSILGEILGALRNVVIVPVEPTPPEAPTVSAAQAFAYQSADQMVRDQLARIGEGARVSVGQTAEADDARAAALVTRLDEGNRMLAGKFDQLLQRVDKLETAQQATARAIRDDTEKRMRERAR